MATTSTKARIKGTYGTLYYAKDMKKAVAFYKDTVGLKPAFESPDWTEFPVNGHSLCLHPATGMKQIPAGGTLILHVDGLDQMVAGLKARGARISDPHEVHPGARTAELFDADGNCVSFYEGPKGA